ncbi:hypothetical protein ACFLQK_01505 [bacterium]
MKSLKETMLLAVVIVTILLPFASGCGGGSGSAPGITTPGGGESGRVAATFRLRRPSAGRAAAQSASGTVRVDITISGYYVTDGTEFEPITTSVDVDLAEGHSTARAVEVPTGVNHLITAVADWGDATETVKAVIPTVSKSVVTYVTVDMASTVAAETAIYYAERESLRLPDVSGDTVQSIGEAISGMAEDGTAYEVMEPAEVLAYMDRAKVVGSLIVAPASVSLQVGGTRQFVVSVLDGNNNEMTDPTIVFDIIPASIGTVTSSGWFTAVSPGTGSLTATCDTITSTATVTVPVQCEFDADCPGDTPVCVGAGADDAFCAACGADAECDDGDPDTIDVCFGAGAMTSSCGNIPPTVSRIAAGGEHACMLMPDTTVQCWGTGVSGQIGNGASYEYVTSPATVSGLTGVKSVTTGHYHSCALMADGAVKCWGRNHCGQLGDGTTTNANTPKSVSGISTATDVSGGLFHTCALLTGGTVKCWGNNLNGQLGDGTVTDAHTPVAVADITAAVSVSAGRYHSCAVQIDGSVWCWGLNLHGQLGSGGNGTTNTPVRVYGISTAVSVDTGRNHTCALLAGGTAKCWGCNQRGELGNGLNVNSNVPVTFGNYTSVDSINAGYTHTCAVLADGSAGCSGFGDSGELGDGVNHIDAAEVLSPVAVTIVGQGVSEISAGLKFTCSLLADGARQCFGNNSSAQLGNGTTN